MAAPRGIDVRQSGGAVLVRVGIDDTAGNALSTGTASLRVCEYQADGTLKQLDFTTGYPLRAAGAAFTAPTATMNPQAAPDGVLTTTGLWDYVLTPAMTANMTVGAVYVVLITHSALAGAVLRREWQYGSVEGDLAVSASGKVAATMAAGDSADAAGLLQALAPYFSTVNDPAATATSFVTGLTGTADLTGSKVVFTTGSLKGVARTIAGMITTTGQVTLLTALPSAPANGSGFAIIQGSKALEQFLAALGSDNRPILSATTHTGAILPRVTLADTLTTYTGNTPQTGDAYARLGPPAGASIAADIQTRSTYAGGPVASVTGPVGSVTAPVSLAASQAFNNTGQTTKVAATLNASDVSGPLTADVARWGGVAVTGMPLPSSSYVAPVNPTDYARSGVAPAWYTAPDNADVASLAASVGPGLGSLVSAIKAKTDALPATPAAAGDIPAGLSALGYTAVRAAGLDNLDAPLSSRLSTSGYQVPPSVGSIAAALLSSPANKLKTDINGAVDVNLTQPIPIVNTAQTHGDALNAARAQGFGPWAIDATAKTLKLFAADGTTPVRTFTLDNMTNPTARA